MFALQNSQHTFNKYGKSVYISSSRMRVERYRINYLHCIRYMFSFPFFYFSPWIKFLFIVTVYQNLQSWSIVWASILMWKNYVTRWTKGLFVRHVCIFGNPHLIKSWMDKQWMNGKQSIFLMKILSNIFDISC